MMRGLHLFILQLVKHFDKSPAMVLKVLVEKASPIRILLVAALQIASLLKMSPGRSLEALWPKVLKGIQFTTYIFQLPRKSPTKMSSNNEDPKNSVEKKDGPQPLADSIIDGMSEEDLELWMQSVEEALEFRNKQEQLWDRGKGSKL
ncbi:hypothetical protein VTJ49DRAFT_579 [Mycothermus thermophilus]|uniref:Uncharacterized protein n=1 Tax=Humicola insolens TaxID=85995 RepID=A0ABR3VFX2_HUMIN